MKDGQKIFYLLGGVAVRIFDERKEEESSEKIAEMIKRKHYATTFYEHGITYPTELLNEHEGWNAFSEIPEELYKLLQNN